jgi:flagellar biosynthesis protein
VIEDGHKDVAVALRYDGGREPAPVVTAKGRGKVAERILTLARAHGIEVREDADLVQVLEKLEIGSTIPPLAFAAVAEILACLYRRNAELAAEHDAGGETRSNELPSDRTMSR